jgi:signal transduction histidine kinase/DNA-binding response OmpR family regulator/ligand-binding sensor domain-containing protein
MHLWLVAIPFLSSGQECVSNVRVFGMEDGLAHFEVHSIYQDSRGFLWIGTRHGLNRFDGNEFLKWSKGKNELTFDKVLEIKEDSEGYLWLLVTNPWSKVPMDINLINIKTLEVTSFKEKFSDTNIDVTSIHSISGNLFSKNEIILLSHSGDYRYNPNEGFQAVELPEVAGGYSLNYHRQSNTLSILSKGKFFSFDTKGNVLDSLSFNKGEENKALDLNIDKDGNRFRYQWSIGVFKVIDNEIHKVPFKDIELLTEHHFYPYEYLYSFAYRATDNTYWFSVLGSKIMVFHPEKGLIHKFKSGLQGVNTLYIDKFGIAWMITFDGLVRVSLEKNKFNHFLNQDLAYTQRLKLGMSPTISTRQIVKYHNELHIATDQSLFKIGKENIPQKIRTSEHAISILPLDSSQIAYGFSDEVFIYKNDKLFKHHQCPIGAYWSMYQDYQGKIWIGGEQGVAVMSDLEKKPSNFHNSNVFPEFSSASFYQFYEKGDNEIWLISTKGIFVLDIKKNKIVRHFGSKIKGKDYLPQDIIHHLYKDKEEENVFWLSTTEGLVKWNSETGEYLIINEDNGLPNNVIYSCYEDDYQHLWLSSNYGIIQLNKKTLESNHYLPKDGLTHYEFNRSSHFQDKDGTIYFGGINGITSFHPKYFYDNLKADSLPLEIVRFQQFSRKKQLLEDKTLALLSDKKITLLPSDLFFTLDFALLDYYQDKQSMYGYKIEGFDKDWNYIRSNSLRINKLPYGNYTLKIKGQTHKGNFSKNIIEIPILVKPPFYFTFGFILLSILAVSLLVYSFYLLRTRQLTQQNQHLEKQVQYRTKQLEEDKLIIEEQTKQLQKLDELKSKFFVNVSHELRTPLTLIISPIQVLLKKIHRFDKQELNLLSTVEYNAFKLLKLTEEVLRLSRLEREEQKVKEEEVFFYNYFFQIFNSYESLAVSKNIRYRLDYQIEKTIIFQMDKNIFEHIITNLISNAFKYTPSNGEITITVKEENNQTQILVSDTGTGIPEEDLAFIFDRYYQTKNSSKWTDGTGIGLALAKELTSLLNGSLTVESQYHKGSTFGLSIPFQKIKTASSSASFVFHENKQLQPAHFSNPTELHYEENRQTLLIVEDNIELRLFLAQMLNQHYNIVLATNGVEALAKLEEDVFHLIISDIMMPQMDGFELLERVKSHHQWLKIPIILLSAKTELSDKLKALTIGIDDYVTKPFEIDELLARIKNSINNVAARNVIEDSSDDSSPAEEEVLKPLDLTWLTEINEIIDKEMTNSAFNIDELAHQSSMSKRQFYRKIKSITGLTPNKYVREYKLQKARILLERNEVRTLAEAAYAIGFDTPHYFATLYEARFGKKPQLYIK